MGRPCYVVTSLLLLAAFTTGCTHKNQPLTHPKLRAGSFAVNQTRAALFIPIQPLAATTRPSIVDEILPLVAPVSDNDGAFVGIAMSGGGSRSANFSAACLFQFERSE